MIKLQPAKHLKFRTGEFGVGVVTLQWRVWLDYIIFNYK